MAVIGLIAAVVMLGVSSSTAAVNSTVFGTDNDGYGAFVTSPVTTNAIDEAWALTADSVNYSFDFLDLGGGTNYLDGTNDTGQVWASLLYENTLVRSSGSAYTIEGVLTLTDGYGDNNNRIGMLLFNDSSVQTNDGGGGIWMRLNTDQDDIKIVEGIAGENILATADTTGNYSGDGWFTNAPLTFSGEVIFTNDVINLQFTLTDYDGVEDSVFAQVAESNYPGLYFGFATKFRNQADTNSNQNVPPVIDYHSFSVSLSTNAPDTTAPAAPTLVSAVKADTKVTLSWAENTEPDLKEYNIYRSLTSGSGFSVVDTAPVAGYADTNVVNGTEYFYYITAVDFSGNESAASAEVSATPSFVPLPSAPILFGSDNDGYGGFATQILSATPERVAWTEFAESVQMSNGAPGTVNTSLLKEFSIDRTNTASYTVTAVFDWSNGYADDNNRFGLYFFGDDPQVPNEDEIGALGLIYNSDDNTVAGPPGNNAQDNLRWMVGIDQSTLSSTPRVGTNEIPYAQDLVGTEVTMGATITFTNIAGTDKIEMLGWMTTISNLTTTVTQIVDRADYTGDYFGFVTRARARNIDSTNAPSPGARNLPWVIDHKSFFIEGGVPLFGYADWASDFGGVEVIGNGDQDFDLDGVNNLTEYGLDGNPTDDADIGYVSYLTAGGAYIHAQRNDDPSLNFTIETSTDLQLGFSPASPTVLGTDVDGRGPGYDIVTNNVGTASDELFIRLLVE